nr:FecR domain-containing protein [uncultured Pseudomonas sp.]
MTTVSAQAVEAIEWYARRASGVFTEQDQQQLMLWLAADPSHLRAWQTLQQQLNRTVTPLVQQQAAAHALRDTGYSRRRLLRGALGLGAMAIGGQLLTQPGGPLHARLRADLRTSTAQRRTFTLEDGSSLQLNAQSSVDLNFSPRQRHVQLLRGAVQAQVRSDPARPFVLACPWGEAWLDSGRCLLAMQASQPQVWALEGALQVRTPDHRHSLVAGQGLAFDGRRWQAIPTHYIDERSWTQGLLEVHDQSLGQVIEHLAPYHPGLLHVSAAAARLRISGVFNLDDTRGALAALKDVLPLRIDNWLGVWTRIEHV